MVGGGVIGLSCAIHLADAGARVRLFEAQVRAPPNASSVAAGMLAPASEALADDLSGEGFKTLLHARDRWVPFAQRLPGLIVRRDGADLHSASPEAHDRSVRLLRERGIDFGDNGPQAPLHLPQDWRIDVAGALEAFRLALNLRDVERVSGLVQGDAGGELTVEGVPLGGEAVVIAAGFASAALAAAAPELARLSAIKGQIVHLAGPSPDRRTQRAHGRYVVPQAEGARAGGTMEPGLSDTGIDPAIAADLQASALAMMPDLHGMVATPHAGVRAATPDGWPLVGPSQAPGVLLATGVRRNGWLLAPLIGEMIAALWSGRDTGRCAPLFHPGRFNR